jgi:hypothetical protein
MECNQVRATIARHFDEDLLRNLPDSVQQHIELCSICQQYYKKLMGLNANILKLREGSKFDPEIFQSMNEVLQEQIYSGARRFPLYLGRLAAIAAILLIAVVWFFRSSNGKEVPFSGEFQLYSAEIEKRPASTIIYQSDKQDDPLIIWIYANGGE